MIQQLVAMRRLTVEQLEASAAELDQAVSAAGYLDRFCSSADWVLPAHAALMSPRDPWLFAGDDGSFVALAGGTHPRGFRYLEPLEASWGLACPSIAGDLARAIEQLADVARRRADAWDVLVLSGFVDARADARIACALGAGYELRRFGETGRHVASLDGGVDGFLARRSRNLRRGLRRARRAARDAGVTFEVADGDAEAIYARIQGVEARTWKGRAGVGIDRGRMRAFYRLVVRRLAARGGLRVIFACVEQRDVAYILGGVLGDGYRGLQFGFDADFAALGLGNLCQLEQVARLADEGIARYDLGTTGTDYKRRWADRVEGSSTLVAVPSPGP